VKSIDVFHKVTPKSRNERGELVHLSPGICEGSNKPSFSSSSSSSWSFDHQPLSPEISSCQLNPRHPTAPLHQLGTVGASNICAKLVVTRVGRG